MKARSQKSEVRGQKSSLISILAFQLFVVSAFSQSDITPPNNQLSGPNGSIVKINADGSITMTAASGAAINVLAGDVYVPTRIDMSTVVSPTLSGAGHASLAFDGTNLLISKNGGAFGQLGATIPSTTSILKGDNAGNASAASASDIKTAASLGNVENTALSTWAGSANITTLGTLTGALTNSYASAASSPALNYTGAWYAAGTGTTNFPHLLLQATGTTASATWSTAGTGIGVNVVTGFAGNLMDLKVAGTSKFKVAANGDLTVGSIIGSEISTGAGVYFQVLSGMTLGWSNRSKIDSPSNGVIRLTNNTQDDFSRLQFGGTTNAFPAIKRNSTALNFRLADDSADAPITAGATSIGAGGGLTVFSATSNANNFISIGGTDSRVIRFSANALGSSCDIVGDNTGAGGPVEFRLGSGGFISWRSTARADSGSNDTGISRNAAGVVEINNGTAGTFRDLKLRDLYSTNATFLHRTATALTDGAGAQVATLTNGPSAGNPTKWIAIDDNGTTRYIPTW